MERKVSGSTKQADRKRHSMSKQERTNETPKVKIERGSKKQLNVAKGENATKDPKKEDNNKENNKMRRARQERI